MATTRPASPAPPAPPAPLVLPPTLPSVPSARTAATIRRLRLETELLTENASKRAASTYALIRGRRVRGEE